LRRYSDTFNGRRLVVVRVDPEDSDLGSVDDVKEAFGADASGIEFLEVPNGKMHEAEGFIDVLSRLESRNPNEAIFYGHDKGVTHPRRKDVLLAIEKQWVYTWEIHMAALRQWRNRVYHECLHDPDKIDSILQRYAACGCYWVAAPVNEKTRSRFKEVGVELWEDPWIFAGAFFWVNSARLFSHPEWKTVAPLRVGPELYLSSMFGRKEVFELYGKNEFRPNIFTWRAVGNYSCDDCGQFIAVVDDDVLCPQCGSKVGPYIALPAMRC